MSKISRAFTVCNEVYEAARTQGINMSQAAEDGIRSRLSMAEIEEHKDELSTKMQEALELMTDSERAKCMEALSRNLSFASGWKRRIKNTTGIIVGEQEIIKVFGPKE